MNKLYIITCLFVSGFVIAQTPAEICGANPTPQNCLPPVAGTTYVPRKMMDIPPLPADPGPSRCPHYGQFRPLLS